MKTWTIAAFVTGLVLIPWIVKKFRRGPLPIQTDPNKRYDIEEFITDQEL
ncbi:MAG: hypothetical protein HY707_01345 [Ignavibacteriae bacterium]|nr:hypothetical protein [Ignavibacteriota bacterium]